jgi:hypothetical protein
VVAEFSEFARRDQLLHMLLNFGAECGAFSLPNLDIVSIFFSAFTDRMAMLTGLPCDCPRRYVCVGRGSFCAN